MLKLFWTPGQGGGVPADVSWQARADSLRADTAASTPLQNIIRKEPGVAAPSAQLARRLDAWLAQRSHAAPVTLMAHGYSYDPRIGGNDDPYHLIYGIPGPGTPNRLSFLPLVGECDELGGALHDVAIAFGWLSSGTMADYGNACWNNDYALAVMDLAPLAARAFATVMAHLTNKGVRFRILAHSLGTRLVGQAIGQLREAHIRPSLERVVLLGGAEFCVDSAAAYAGCRFDVINLGSRQDIVLAVGAEEGCHPVRFNGSPAACVLGRNGLGGNPQWLDWQIDDDRVVTWLSSGQAPTGTPYQVSAVPEDNVHATGNLGHWVYYTNRGNRALVHDLVQHPAMTLAKLKQAGAPNDFASAMYGRFNGLDIPETPLTCAERRGETLMASNMPSGTA